MCNSREGHKGTTPTHQGIPNFPHHSGSVGKPHSPISPSRTAQLEEDYQDPRETFAGGLPAQGVQPAYQWNPAWAGRKVWRPGINTEQDGCRLNTVLA